MFRVAIIDDEYTDRKLLADYFIKLQSEIKEDIQISEYTSGDKYLYANDGKADLICLDILMEGKDGFSIAKEIRKKDENVLIIFITNMAQMAIRGYEVHALDFVIKPVTYYSFALKMKSAFDIIKKQRSKSVLLQTVDGARRVNAEDIYYIEVSDHYLLYHTKTGNYRQKASLREIEIQLTDLSFVRCNNCYLVNLKYVDCIEKDEVLVAGDWLKISRPRRKELLKSMANFMGGIT